MPDLKIYNGNQLVDTIEVSAEDLAVMGHEMPGRNEELIGVINDKGQVEVNTYPKGAYVAGGEESRAPQVKTGAEVNTSRMELKTTGDTDKTAARALLDVANELVEGKQTAEVKSTRAELGAFIQANLGMSLEQVAALDDSQNSRKARNQLEDKIESGVKEFSITVNTDKGVQDRKVDFDDAIATEALRATRALDNSSEEYSREGYPANQVGESPEATQRSK